MEAMVTRSCVSERLEAHVERIRISDLFPADRGLSVRDREFDLSVVAEGIRGRDAARALFPALNRDRPPFFSRGILFEQRRWGDRHLTPVDGLLRAPSARALLSRRHGLAGVAVSPTRLGQYMACPYQYFCERVLGLEPWTHRSRSRGCPRRIAASWCIGCSTNSSRACTTPGWRRSARPRDQ